jgi:hypothetical protein
MSLLRPRPRVARVGQSTTTMDTAGPVVTRGRSATRRRATQGMPFPPRTPSAARAAGRASEATSGVLTGGGDATAMANAVATGGVGGAGSPPGASGAANATSSATTAKGALAQAQSTALGSSGQAQSTAKTNLAGVSVQSSAVAPTDLSTATTNAIAQGRSGPTFVNPGQTAYAFSTALPDKPTLQL